MKIKLVFDIIPMAIQSVRATSRGHFYQPQKNIDYKTALAYQAKCQLPANFQPFDGIIIIYQLIYKFPILKSMNKDLKNSILKGNPVFKETKPDLDNLFKGFFDALRGIVWRDDAGIAVIKDTSKMYAINPGIILEVDDF